MYLVPYHDIIVSGNFSAQQGPPVTRQINCAVRFTTNQGRTTVTRPVSFIGFRELTSARGNALLQLF